MRWEDIKRFQVIEAILLWEGKLTTRHLTEYFSISRPSAQKFISEYKQLNADGFEFDHSEKGHIAKADFVPQFIDQNFSTYHTLFSSQPTDNVFGQAVECLPQLKRNVSANLVRPLLLAIRHQRRLDIGYLSLSSPDYEDRIIQPHSLVFDGSRYHVRAYCEKNGDFRDFVLSRFSGEFDFEGAAQFSAEQDTKWQTMLTLVICPDHRLGEKQKKCIEFDYQMENGQKEIPIRAALLKYLLHALRVDIYQPSAEQQQIVIEPECRKALAEYL